MQRMFFHNQHDKDSTAILATLDGTVRVYDVFGDDKQNLPENIKLSILPYMVDKYIDYVVEEPYTIYAPFTLNFNCKNHLGYLLTDETEIFRVAIDGVSYDAIPENGIIQIELVCTEARKIQISIDGFGYLPFSTEIEVVDDAED